MKHIVCYSGGHTSALVAVEVARKFGAENTVLLNHDINPSVEDADIKRFKNEVANYLGLPVTFANMDGWEVMDQFDTVVKAKAFKVRNGTALCTHRLKTEPFERYLASTFGKAGGTECVIYYGFEPKETDRIQRRSSHLASLGYKTDFPLALWQERTIQHTSEIDIRPPLTYAVFKHGNCVGCLKAGRQHWYVVYCVRPDIFAKGKQSEDVIGYSIIKGVYLDELEPIFAIMQAAGVPATEHIPAHEFWAIAQKAIDEARGVNKRGQLLMMLDEADAKPCECVM